MSAFDLKQVLEEEISKIGLGWDIKGVIDSQKRIYTIPNDTKLISKVFELVTAPLIFAVSEKHKIRIVESDRQTVYPDFTLILPDDTKLAVDVKSTYRRNGTEIAGFTLGSYTGYLRHPTKNIMFPYHEYTEHWVLGFIYTREPKAKSDIVLLTQIDNILATIKELEVIVQPKYKVAADRPGSGNTKNVGSVTDITALRAGNGIFAQHGQAVFEDYWRNFVQRKEARAANKSQPYHNFQEYLAWKKAEAKAPPSLSN